MSFLIKFEELLQNHKTRLSWDEYHMMIALGASSRSPDQRLKVGCVLVKDRRVIATGYNGHVSGASHESKLDEKGHEVRTIHSELNATSDAAKRGVSVLDAICYVTRFPCINCAKALVSSGIKEVKYLHDYKNDPDAMYIFEQAGVKVEKMDELLE
jgi:dCMP deaminase